MSNEEIFTIASRFSNFFATNHTRTIDDEARHRCKSTTQHVTTTCRDDIWGCCAMTMKDDDVAMMMTMHDDDDDAW